ncbi:hypothetical protein [Fodinicola feengrottensis]|uniref:Uncharacterized protein n=1 Tax=Fodinicola feengrottensis TaxID=435914 RepID=A0ABN2GJR5_9ACTN|nr:hypothetical protein [Fodinicola feengrottensis]
MTSFQFRIDQVERDWSGSGDVLLAGELLATGYNPKVGDVIAVPTASGVVRGRITGFPLIKFVDHRWIGVTVSCKDAFNILRGRIADIPAIDPAASDEEQGRTS